MNEFERRNLARLSSQHQEAEKVFSEVRQQAMNQLNRNAEKMARIIVWSYFDEGLSPAEVKDRLRKDKDVFEGLNLTTIINETYSTIQQQRNQLAVGRWSKETQHAFGEWFSRHRRASREGNTR